MVAEYFSNDYFQARAKFLDAASAAGGVVESHLNPNGAGPDGEAIYTDVAVFGDPTLPKVVMIISATHGNEGFLVLAVRLPICKKAG